MLNGHIGRVIQVGRKWQRITLTDDEENQVLDWLRKRNLQMFQQCLQDAEELAGDKAHAMSIAIALFNHLALGAYTAIDEALEARMHELKEQASGTGEDLIEVLETMRKWGVKETDPAYQEVSAKAKELERKREEGKSPKR